MNVGLFFYKDKEIPVQCLILTFGWFPGVWILYADVSEHSVFSIFKGGVTRKNLPTYTAYEDGTDRVFRNVGIWNSDAGESPKSENTTFRTRRKFEIKNSPCTNLESPCGFQEVEVSRFQDSRHMNVIRLSALSNGPPLPPSNIPSTHFC